MIQHLNGFSRFPPSDNGHRQLILPSRDQEIWELPEPTNFATERAVLAVMLYDGFDDERLCVDLFANYDNRNWFRVMDDLRHVEGIEISPHSVATELAKRKQLDPFDNGL